AVRGSAMSRRSRRRWIGSLRAGKRREGKNKEENSNGLGYGHRIPQAKCYFLVSVYSNGNLGATRRLPSADETRRPIFFYLDNSYVTKVKVSVRNYTANAAFVCKKQNDR